MASRDFRRRTVTAAALYGGTAAGILGTLIAVRVLGPDQFGLLTIALAAAGFVQLLLDTTVEEAIVKYGIRYAATDDWGRLRGLFRAGIAIKWGGGALATLVILVLVPFADALFDEPDLTAPLDRCRLHPRRAGAGGDRGSGDDRRRPLRPESDIRWSCDGLPARRCRRRCAVRRHVGRRRDPRRPDRRLVRFGPRRASALLPSPGGRSDRASS